jgi:hypothetical protein
MKPARTLLFLVCVTASCAQAETTPPPQSPAPAAAPAPLPTALDLMAAHARELELRPEQLTRLKALGTELAATNAPLEQSLAKLEPDKPASESSEAPPPAMGRRGGGRGGAFRGGGRGGMGMGGGGMGMGGGGRGRGGSPRPAPATAQARPHSDQAQAVRAQMADNHAAAVARAFAILDDAQQEKAARLLDENDFDPPAVDSVRAARAHDAQPHATTP